MRLRILLIACALLGCEQNTQELVAQKEAEMRAVRDDLFHIRVEAQRRRLEQAEAHERLAFDPAAQKRSDQAWRDAEAVRHDIDEHASATYVERISELQHEVRALKSSPPR